MKSRSLFGYLLSLGMLMLLMSGGRAHAAAEGAATIRPLPAIYTTAKAINYSPYRAAGPNYGEVPSDAHILQDLGLLNLAGYDLVRLYNSAGDVPKKILRLAEEKYPSMRFQLGIFIISPANAPYNALEISSGIDLANKYSNVVAVSVGNETSIAANPVSTVQLAAMISQVRAGVVQPLTTNQIAFFYNIGAAPDQNPTVVLRVIDFVAYHSYPEFESGGWNWQVPTAGGLMSGAIKNQKLIFKLVAGYRYINALGRSVTIGSSLPIVIGETGWKAFSTNPTDPQVGLFEQVTGSQINQKWYLDLLEQWVQSKVSAPVNFFYFEAFNEPWKATDDGWGLWNIVRTPQYALCATAAARSVCRPTVYAGAGRYPNIQNKSPIVFVDPNQAWIGYVQPFNIDLTPMPGFGYPATLLGASFTTPKNPAVASGNTVVLVPNTKLWNPAIPYWVNPNGTPNKIVSSAFYVENKNLVGATLDFKGKTLENTLGIEPSTGFQYRAIAFIRAFNQDYSWLMASVTVPLVGGQPFDFQLNTVGAAHVVYGFELTGPVANPATAAGLGRVRIVSKP